MTTSKMESGLHCLYIYDAIICIQPYTYNCKYSSITHFNVQLFKNNHSKKIFYSRFSLKLGGDDYVCHQNMKLKLSNKPIL